MSTLLTRTTTLIAALTLGLGLSACGDDGATGGAAGNGTTAPAPTSSVAAGVDKAVQEKANELRSNVRSSQKQLDAISDDIKSGKTDAKKGQQEIEKITKDLQDQADDLGKQAAETAAREAGKSGEKVTQLNLDGGDAGSGK